MRVLLKFGADMNLVNQDLFTPLDCVLHWQKSSPARATGNAQRSISRLLLSYGAFANHYGCRVKTQPTVAEATALPMSIPTAVAMPVPSAPPLDDSSRKIMLDDVRAATQPEQLEVALSRCSGMNHQQKEELREVALAKFEEAPSIWTPTVAAAYSKLSRT